MSSQGVCAACNRTIDAAAKLCPYCGANPQSGERLDTQAILQEIFRPKEMTTSDTVIEYARQRQGIVVAVSLIIGFLIIVALHQFVTRRNANVQSDMPAVPLTEITDVTNRNNETAPVKLPDLNFQYDGTPRRMRTYVVERGAVTPPEVLAAQQAARAAAQPQQPQPQQPQQPGAAAPRPVAPPAQAPVRQPTR